VSHITYRFDLATGSAESTLALDVTPPGGDCYGVSCAIEVSSVTWNGAPATSSAVDMGTLHACGTSVAETLTLGSAAMVPEQTFFGLDVGLSRRPSMGGGTFTYLLSWVGGCDLFGPCDDDPALLTAFDFEVTHPSGTTVLCPGTVEPGDTLTRCTLDGTLAPTYSAFAIAADDNWQKTNFTSAAGVSLVFYEAPGGALAASLEVTRVQEFMTWVTGLLGAYPYGNELRIAGGPTAWLGFEHPGNIVLLDELPTIPTSYSDATMHVFMHEVVHQWAGDRTTLASVQDFVWKEAIAEYLAYVFEDEQGPPGEALATRTYWDNVAVQAEYYPRPTDDPAPPVHIFYGDVYGPGPMTLFVQLEPFVGRATVLEAIAAFLSSPGARSVDDLRAALEQASGEDLQYYFDTWVVGSGAPTWPAFTANVMQTGDQVNVTLTQTTGAPHPCRVQVQVAGATTSAIALVDFGLHPTSAVASATVTLAEPVVTVTIDPNHQVINTPMGTAASEPLPVWIF
jgi:aminopeptidase N